MVASPILRTETRYRTRVGCPVVRAVGNLVAVGAVVGATEGRALGVGIGVGAAQQTAPPTASPSARASAQVTARAVVRVSARASSVGDDDGADDGSDDGADDGGDDGADDGADNSEDEENDGVCLSLAHGWAPLAAYLLIERVPRQTLRVSSTTSSHITDMYLGVTFSRLFSYKLCGNHEGI